MSLGLTALFLKRWAVDPDTETLTEHAPEWMAWIENANESRGR